MVHSSLCWCQVQGVVAISNVGFAVINRVKITHRSNDNKVCILLASGDLWIKIYSQKYYIALGLILKSPSLSLLNHNGWHWMWTVMPILKLNQMPHNTYTFLIFSWFLEINSIHTFIPNQKLEKNENSNTCRESPDLKNIRSSECDIYKIRCLFKKI